ncbi:hypothetical protein [Peribacillus kribbensis]|nr:hypothetical protein [Peribacillus kribbensis]
MKDRNSGFTLLDMYEDHIVTKPAGMVEAGDEGGHMRNYLDELKHLEPD